MLNVSMYREYITFLYHQMTKAEAEGKSIEIHEWYVHTVDFIQYIIKL